MAETNTTPPTDDTHLSPPAAGSKAEPFFGPGAGYVAFVLGVGIPLVFGLAAAISFVEPYATAYVEQTIEHWNDPVCQYHAVPQADGTTKLYDC